MARRRVRRRNYSFSRYTETNRGRDIAVGVAKWCGQIAIVILLAFLTVQFGVQTLTVRGESLEETYSDGDVVLVNKFIYKISEPKRYDMAAFRTGSEDGHYSIKRIVGVPGDSIIIEDGVLKINGESVDLFPAFSDINYAGLASEEIILDENEYFVMGDNCNNSEDSRVASVGNIERENMIGKVQTKLYKKKG
ncbi:MAG: signal peptidase I [Lachnospiraceae bacterium]|nr:signal peptidase I [Lachnospiraceae bacterium]